MSILNTIVLHRVKTNVFADANKFNDNCHMTLAERIKKAREHANLSQDALADAIGCSVDLVRKLEQGNRSGTTFLIKIAKACKVNAEWLDDESGYMQKENNYDLNHEMVEHLKVMQQLPGYARTEVIRDAIKTAELITKAQAEAPKHNTQ